METYASGKDGEMKVQGRKTCGGEEEKEEKEKKIERGAGRKDITRKGSGGKGAESLPKRSLYEKEEKGRERGKKRHVREEEKEDLV